MGAVLIGVLDYRLLLAVAALGLLAAGVFLTLAENDRTQPVTSR